MPPHRLVAALVLGLTAAACQLPEPTPEDWQATGFRTPEQTFHTFQTALAADQADLEYRSLSSDFRRRGLGSGPVTQLEYRLWRNELAREEPWFRHLSRAEIEASHSSDAPGAIGAKRHRLVAEVSFLWRSWRFEVELVREDFYELWSGDELVDDDLANFSELVDIAQPVSGVSRSLAVRVPLNDWVEPRDLGEIRIGREWKIDGFRLLEDGDRDSSP